MASARKSKKPVVVAVSGGFDPVHVGHVRMFDDAKKLGDTLVVILNNDNWLEAKKGKPFMPEKERKELLESLHVVDKVIVTRHPKNPTDLSVCDALEALKPDIFANGGDRTHNNIPEVPLCEKIGCQMVFGVGKGGKVQSSSWLLQTYQKNSEEKSKPRLLSPQIGIGIMILKDGKVLMGKRRGSHGAGEYSFPGGHLEYTESFEECALREIMEECGIKVQDIRFGCCANIVKYAPKHSVLVGLVADWKSGVPEVKEPDKCESWDWYDFSALPKPLFLPSRLMIENFKTGRNYWDSKN